MSTKLLKDIVEGLAGTGDRRPTEDVISAAVVSGTITAITAPGAGFRLVIHKVAGLVTTTNASELTFRSGASGKWYWAIAANSTDNYQFDWGPQGWPMNENATFTIFHSAAVTSHKVGILYSIEPV